MPFSAGLWEALLRDLPLLFPQIILIVTATVMLWPGDLFVPRGEKRRWAFVTIFALAVAPFRGARAGGPGSSDMFAVDGMTKGFQYLVLAAGAITVLLSQLQLDALARADGGILRPAAVLHIRHAVPGGRHRPDLHLLLP